jgi:uncharacterized membrane protein
MRTGRLEAFSDGVLAIVITIMVLEMKVPEHAARLADLTPLLPVFLSYVLSFVYIGIYWNNHHHLLHAAEFVSGGILWANLHLLFWLSLVPFVTAWMGESHFAPLAVAVYGVPLLLAGVAYYILERALIAHHRHDPMLAAAVGADVKGVVSILLYASAIPVAFVLPWLSCALYVAVAVLWLVPDRRIERALAARS